MFLATYDWRLPLDQLEERDAFFSGLMVRIELMVRSNGGRTAVVVSHSMGTPVWLHFMQWVLSSEASGGGGKTTAWLDTHISTWVNLAGSLLGAPKSLTAVLSGEARDTAELGTVQRWISDSFFSRLDMIHLFRSLGSLPALFPRGGSTIWGRDPAGLGEGGGSQGSQDGHQQQQQQQQQQGHTGNEASAATDAVSPEDVGRGEGRFMTFDARASAEIDAKKMFLDLDMDGSGLLSAHVRYFTRMRALHLLPYTIPSNLQPSHANSMLGPTQRRNARGSS